MKSKLHLLLTFCISIVCTVNAVAQTGTIKGVLTDKTNNETLIGATIMVSGTGLGAVTDIDGAYQIDKVPTGTYTIKITFVGYVTDEIQGVVVKNGETTQLNHQLRNDSKTLKDAQVVSTRITNTENAVLAEMRKSEQVVIGVSSQQIAKTQDRSASEIIRRLPGVTVMEDRFVVIRGLSERYNAVVLNETFAPSAEPDKKAFSFDIIPSAMIDRVLIYKTGAPELPGEFAGGAVKIYTKNVPDEDYISAGVTLGVRSNTTFKTFNRASNSNTDWLGIDNGSRDLPGDFPTNISGLTTEQQIELAKLLPNTWIAKEQSAPIDQRYNLNFAKKFNLGKVKAANITAVTYSNTYETREAENLNYNQYDVVNNISDTIYNFNDVTNNNKVSLGVLSNFSFILNPHHKIEFRNLYNQSGSNATTIRTGFNLEEGNEVRNYAFRYFERTMYTGQLSGTHDFNQDKTKLNWTLGYNKTNTNEPDYRRIRTFRSLVDNLPDYFVQVNSTASQADAGRFYSTLEESSYIASLNAEQEVLKLSETRKLKIRAGFYMESKDRNFQARWLAYTKSRIDQFDNSLLQLPLDQIFSSNNFNDSTGFTIDEGTNGTDRYTASNELIATYIGTTWPVTDKLNVSGGVRFEYNRLILESADNNGKPLTVDNPISSLLPSINISYNVTQKSLIRVAYAKTLNRPEFREIAPFAYYDFVFNNVLFGNTELETPTIHNFDLRWEKYPAAGEFIAGGVFYKHFINPIEQYFKPGAGSGGTRNFEFRNAPSAFSAGAELEIRKSLEPIFKAGFLSRLAIGANASYIISEVDLGKEAVGQDRKRMMMGQSPYVINTGIFYTQPEYKLQCNLQYNIIGRRLFVVGTQGTPDVYELPRNVFDFSITKGIGKNIEIKAGVQDILNQAVVLRQDSNEDGHINNNDELLFKYNRGSYYTLGFTVRY
ncbi:MAG: TonB-dependent receptor [Bacteroidia bacterium]|jgi:TonB-dependent receptor|nr:TonB-dependent receptor [Bacteroidia bacterium]